MRHKIIMAIAGLAWLFSGHLFHAFGQQALGQNVKVTNSPREPIPIWTAQPASVRVLQPLETDFERYSRAHIGHPVLALTLPAVLTRLSSNITLQLAPQILTVLHDPSTPKALAADVSFSSSPEATPAGPGEFHVVRTFMDFDELSAFRSLLAMLAASGVPPSPVPEAKAHLSITSKTGTRLEFTDLGGTIHCTITNEFDSVSLLLKSDAMKKMADAFFAARENLDSASDNLR